MRRRTLITVLLVVGLIVPAAGASAVPSAAPYDPSGGSGSADASGSSDASNANYTRLYVDDGYRHLELKPGESDSVTVVVENGEDEAVEVSPRLVVPRVGGRPLNSEWVDIDTPTTTVEPGEELEVTVTVSVPDGVDLGRYRGWIAFTNETAAYPGQPPRPVHAATVNVEVWKEPTVYVRSGRHVYTQVEAGDGFTHEIVVENTGDEAVPLQPELADERGHCYGDCPSVVERSWLDIDAPAEVAPGETATVNVTVTPPSDAERGRYDTELTLGLRDPAREDRNDYWQRVSLGFLVWTQPTEPFETTFDVSEDATDVTLTLSAGEPHSRGTDARDRPVAFDVEFVSPDGDVVDADRVEVTDNGYVDLTEGDANTDGDYATRGGQREFVYRLDDPTAGEWAVRIMPENVVRFGYEITRNETDG